MQLKRLITLTALGGLSCLAQTLVQLKTVKGAPFSADAITEVTHVLGDGNRVVRQTTARIARDSEGRTRHEQNLSQTGLKADGPSVVFIVDPVAALAYVLDPKYKRASRWPMSAVDADGRQFGLQSGGDHPKRADLKTESIGIQMIEGFQAEGTRITRTLAAGQAGNERPLDITSEVWYSTELQVVLLNRTTDPRFGETVYKLIDITRDEPIQSLFAVSSEYTLRDEVPTPDSRSMEKDIKK
jgi:hypothetical protein